MRIEVLILAGVASAQYAPAKTCAPCTRSIGRYTLHACSLCPDCPAGHKCDSHGTATKCPANTYSPGGKTGKCLDCVNQWSLEGASACSDYTLTLTTVSMDTNSVIGLPAGAKLTSNVGSNKY